MKQTSCAISATERRETFRDIGGGLLKRSIALPRGLQENGLGLSALATSVPRCALSDDRTVTQEEKEEEEEGEDDTEEEQERRGHVNVHLNPTQHV